MYITFLKVWRPAHMEIFARYKKLSSVKNKIADIGEKSKGTKLLRGIELPCHSFVFSSLIHLSALTLPEV